MNPTPSKVAVQATTIGALALIQEAARFASRGRKSTVSDLTGPERRRMRRFLVRRERRLAGVYPVGAIAPALCHRTRTEG